MTAAPYGGCAEQFLLQLLPYRLHFIRGIAGIGAQPALLMKMLDLVACQLKFSVHSSGIVRFYI